MLLDCRSADRPAYGSVDAHRDRGRWNLVSMTSWRTSAVLTWNRPSSGIGRRRMCFSDVRPGVFPRSVAWLRRQDLGNAPNTPRGGWVKTTQSSTLWGMGQLWRNRWLAAVTIALVAAACSNSAPHESDRTEQPPLTVTSTSTDGAMDLDEGNRLQQELNTTDVGVTMTALSDAAIRGELLVYVMTVSNFGPNPASQMLLSVVLPSELRRVEVDVDCDEAASGLSCDLGEIGAGQSKDIHFTFQVLSSASPSRIITNVAEIENLAGPDPDLTNNVSYVTLPLVSPDS
jgi:uncharacterized repeat protein (TIGR01451 family)